MRIVIDTVVVVRGLMDPFSRSGKLLFERADHYRWVVSPEIAAEYMHVLGRPRLMNRFLAAENRDLGAVLNRIEAALVVNPAPIPPICRDPSDDTFLAAADASSARFLVTEDNDLLAVGLYGETTICSVHDFLRFLDRDARTTTDAEV